MEDSKAYPEGQSVNNTPSDSSLRSVSIRPQDTARVYTTDFTAVIDGAGVPFGREDTRFPEEGCYFICNEGDNTITMRRGNNDSCVVHIDDFTLPRRGYNISFKQVNSMGHAKTPTHNLETNSSARRSMTDEGILAKLKTKTDLASTRTMRYSGTTVLNASKYRKEFMMITKRDEDTSTKFCDSRAYHLCYIGILITYGILLGLSTSLDWNNISETWLRAIFTLRYVFTAIFAVDLAINLCSHGFSILFDKPELLIDTLLLICETGTLLYLTTKLSRDFNFKSMPTDTWRSLIKQAKLSSCISMVRLYKICVMCQPLSSLSKGIALSIRSLLWTAVFVLLVIYGCAIFTTWVFTDVDDATMYEYWGTLPRSMYTLFTILTLEGWNDVSDNTAVFYPYSKLFFVLFVSFATLTVMNVVTGIILDTFLTVNEKLTGERATRGKCKRNIVITKIVTDALNSKKNNGAGDSFMPFERKFTCYPNAGFRRTATNSIEHTSDVPSANINASDSWSLQRIGRNVGNMFRQLQGKTSRLFNTGRDDLNETVDDLQDRRHQYRINNVNTHNEGDGYHCTPGNTQIPIHVEAGSRGKENKCQYKPKVRTTVPRITEECSILNELIDKDTAAEAEPNPSFSVDEVSRNLQEGKSLEGYDSPFVPSKAPSYRETIFNAFSKMTTGVDSSILDAPYTNGIIDMTDKDPFTFLSDPVMAKALRLAGVPMYQAYEVLNLYYSNELYKLTVAEFAGACDRLTGNASNRDILSFELAMTRRLDVIEAALEQFGSKVEALTKELARRKN
ncbi:hypothetical protein BgAZ_104760 [Babesia gibsoni]|uniref:Ion transport domain-containing protein n=1 Tax=Babesia gibsoni TaxID=33632 RepID=A0AAD8PFP2_BABGI|nr:hypothetical protein BgAZ_104760 [Babesia gibsoni]